jgi:hypothetical protein
MSGGSQIRVNANIITFPDVNTNSNVILSEGNQTIGGTKTFSNSIEADISGNAGTATTLQTARTIWGQNFNGSANVYGDLTSVGNITGTGAITLTAGGTNQSITLTPSGTGVVNASTSLSEGGTALTTKYVQTGAVNQTIGGTKTFSSTITGSVSGNAGTATTLQTARTIAISGGATGTATSFNGGANITIPVTGLNANNLNAGTVPDARLSGTYSGFTHKMDGTNTVFTTPNSGTSNTSARTVYGLAEYRSTSNTQTGAIVFIQSTTASSIMYQLEIAGMQYSPARITKITVQGYRTTGTWSVTNKISTGEQDVDARWAVDPTGKNCLILGDVGTVWSYPHFSIVRAMFSHTGASDAICTGWTVGVVTDLTGYTNITAVLANSSLSTSISGNAETSTTLATPRTLWGQNFNGSANVSGNVTGVGNITGTGAITVTAGGTNQNISLTPSGSGTVNAPTFNATSTTNGGFQGIAADSEAVPSHTWTGDLDTGMYRAGTNIIGFTAGGTERARIATNGMTLAVQLTAPSLQITTGTGIGVGTATPSTSFNVNIADSFSPDATRAGIQNIVNVLDGTLTNNRVHYGILNSIRNDYLSEESFALTQRGSQNEVINGPSNDALATLTTAEGARNSVLNRATGSIATAVGAYNVVSNSRSGASITNGRGSFNEVTVGGGSLATAVGVWSRVRPTNSAATLTTGYLFFGENASITGTFTNRWGVYIQPTWNNFFAGGIQVGGTPTGSTSAAGLGVGTGPPGAGNITASGDINATTFNATSTTNGGFQGIAADSATLPSFTWTGDLDTGMYRAAADTIGFTTGGTERVRIASNGNVSVIGALSKGSGSFKIDHPLPEKTETHHLVHSFIEGPRADLIYRGRVDLVNGEAYVNIDQSAGMTEGTFVALCRDIQCFVSNETDWDAVKGKVTGNQLHIRCQNQQSTATISWLVIGERKDKHMYDTDWTDNNGRVIVEPLKTNT